MKIIISWNPNFSFFILELLLQREKRMAYLLIYYHSYLHRLGYREKSYKITIFNLNIWGIMCGLERRGSRGSTKQNKVQFKPTVQQNNEWRRIGLCSGFTSQRFLLEKSTWPYRKYSWVANEKALWFLERRVFGNKCNIRLCSCLHLSSLC